MAAERKAAGLLRQPAGRRQRNPDKESGWSAEFAMDKGVVVSEAELLVLEAYLGKQLDALFGGGHPSRNESVLLDEAENPPMRKRG
jgi:hypothetical protein